MNRVFSLILFVSTLLVTEAQYSFKKELYRRPRQRNILQTPASLDQATAPAALPVPAPVPVPDSPVPAAVPLSAALVHEVPAVTEAHGQNGFNIAHLFRYEWERILPKIILESEHEKTAALIQEMVDVNPCVDSLDAYVAFLEQRVQIVERYGPEIETMLQKVISLRGEKNLGVILGTGSDILNILDTVSYGFITSFTCQAVTDVGVDAIRNLALNLYKQALVGDIPNVSTPSVRKNLYMSARVTEAISNIVDHFSANVARTSCYTSTDAFGDFIEVLSASLSDIGEAFGALEYFEEAKEIRQYSKFILSIKNSLGQSSDFKTPGDCSPGALKRNAALLREVSNTVRDVDMETLFLETGVSFRLDLLP